MRDVIGCEDMCGDRLCITLVDWKCVVKISLRNQTVMMTLRDSRF